MKLRQNVVLDGGVEQLKAKEKKKMEGENCLIENCGRYSEQVFFVASESHGQLP